jgi:GT2 family glycosyltransferase
MTAARLKRQIAGIPMRLVMAVRGAVLHRPLLRAGLRAIGAPLIRLAMRLDRRPPPATPQLAAEPVLRLPLDYVPGPLSPAPRIAVLLHASDAAAAAAFAPALRRLGVAADLLVSSPAGAPPPAAAAELLASWTAGPGELRVEPAAGGLGAQLAVWAPALGDYDLVLVVRAEQAAPGSPEAAQRALVLSTLLGTPGQTRAVVEAFVQALRLGIVAPRTAPAVRAQMVWDGLYEPCRKLAAALGRALFADGPADFPAGGAFWARPSALRPLLEAPGLAASPPGVAERLVFHACERAGLHWARAGDDRGAAPPETFYRAAIPRSLERAATDCARTVLPPGRPAQPTPLPSGSPTARKEAFRAACRDELALFLAGEDRLSLPTSDKPLVSIVVLLFNQAELTFQCLRSLQHALDLPCEIIIADNASSDRTGELLDRVDGARIVRNSENLHFVRGVNAAADLARGEHLLLLNNDTRVTPGSIGAAVGLLDEDPGVGAVGGRIELLDGTLQEAGSIIWRDGSCVGYGRGADPCAPEFQFRREVDYCSGAFLMVRRALFEQLGRFDEAFAPAYYEETDLCMRIRAAGASVVYEPGVHISHFEFGSSAGSAAAVALQTRNQAIFAARHAQALAADHLPSGGSQLAARMRGRFAGRVLVLEDQVPYPHLGSGYPRAVDILEAVRRAGWFATLFPMSYPDIDPELARAMLPAGLEIAGELGRERLAAFLRARAGYYDAVIVSRPHNMGFFRAALAQAPNFIALENVLYDAEAIFAQRGDGPRAGRLDPLMLEAELALAAGVGCVFAVNARDARTFHDHGAPCVEVVGHALEPQPTRRPFADRRDLLFVGALDAEGSPNADSLVHFVREVMPRLDARIGEDWILRVAGRTGAASVRALAGPRVQLLGRVDELAPLFDQSRLFVAPTRFAAGIPMKVHSAAAAGVPAAVTPLLAEQLGWMDGAEVAVGAGAEGFAEACRRLYQDAELWRRVRAGALAKVAAECEPEAFSARIAGALAAVRRPQAASSSSSLRMSVTGEATPPSRRMTLLQ